MSDNILGPTSTMQRRHFEATKAGTLRYSVSTVQLPGALGGATEVSVSGTVFVYVLGGDQAGATNTFIQLGDNADRVLLRIGDKYRISPIDRIRLTSAVATGGAKSWMLLTSNDPYFDLQSPGDFGGGADRGIWSVR